MTLALPPRQHGQVHAAINDQKPSTANGNKLDDLMLSGGTSGM
jgi:hypothetical protein